MVVECGALIGQVVGADDGGVAAGVAAADPAFFEHRDVGEAVLAGEGVGRSQPVPPAPDDQGVISGPWPPAAPPPRPTPPARPAPAPPPPARAKGAGPPRHRA